MYIQLIHGHFDANDAIDIITKMILIKIKYYEDKINNSLNEDDDKSREVKIKNLHKDLFKVRSMPSIQEAILLSKQI